MLVCSGALTFIFLPRCLIIAYCSHDSVALFFVCVEIDFELCIQPTICPLNLTTHTSQCILARTNLAGSDRMAAGCLFDSGFSLTDPGSVAAHGEGDKYKYVTSSPLPLERCSVMRISPRHWRFPPVLLLDLSRPFCPMPCLIGISCLVGRMTTCCTRTWPCSPWRMGPVTSSAYGGRGTRWEPWLALNHP